MTIRKDRKTANISSPRRLIWILLAPVDGDIGRIQFHGDAGGKRLAFALTHGQVARAGFLDELPSVETAALRLAIVEYAHFLAEQVIPVLALEFEVVGGILALVD